MEDKLDATEHPGPFAQLADRGADDAKVVSSSLTLTMRGTQVNFTVSALSR